MFRRHNVLASFTAGAFRPLHPLKTLGSCRAARVACLGVALVAGLSAAGCKDDTQATPRVVFDSEIQPGTHSVKDCPKTGPEFTIGSFGNPMLGRVDPANPDSPLKVPVVPVDDGGDDQQGKVSISCSVTANGDSFDVSAQAILSGATGGSVTIAGTFGRAGDIPNITMNLSKGGETFSAHDCVVRYDTSLGHAVAAGRVWAEIDCANAMNPGAQQTCATHAEFRFENCSQ
jgi:hypothetical protein